MSKGIAIIAFFALCLVISCRPATPAEIAAEAQPVINTNPESSFKVLEKAMADDKEFLVISYDGKKYLIVYVGGGNGGPAVTMTPLEDKNGTN